MAKEYDGWVFRNQWGSYLLWTAGTTKKEVIRKVPHINTWLKLGGKIVKFKIVEVA